METPRLPKLTLNTIEGKLSRADMKKIMGGMEELRADDGSGGGGSYKCCADGSGTYSGCSACVSCNSSCTCESGSYLVAC